MLPRIPFAKVSDMVRGVVDQAAEAAEAAVHDSSSRLLVETEDKHDQLTDVVTLALFAKECSKTEPLSNVSVPATLEQSQPSKVRNVLQMIALVAGVRYSELGFAPEGSAATSRNLGAALENVEGGAQEDRAERHTCPPALTEELASIGFAPSSSGVSREQLGSLLDAAAKQHIDADTANAIGEARTNMDNIFPLVDSDNDNKVNLDEFCHAYFRFQMMVRAREFMNMGTFF